MRMPRRARRAFPFKYRRQTGQIRPSLSTLAKMNQAEPSRQRSISALLFGGPLVRKQEGVNAEWNEHCHQDWGFRDDGLNV